MSSVAMFVATGGMKSQSSKIATIGNNIANSTTVGYKSNTMQFTEQFVSLKGTFATGATTYQGNGVQVASTPTDWTDGTTRETDDISHIAIVGDGFLPVSFNGDTLFSRAGDFQMVETTAGSGQFVLMRPNGSVLQGAATAGGAVAGAVTFDALPSTFQIGNDGTVTASGSNVTNAQIGLQRFANPDALIRLKGGLFQSTVSAAPTSTDPLEPGTNGSGTLLQGALEQSNVDLVDEFTEIIITQRAYSANAKTIQTAGEMLQEALNLKR